MFSQPMPCYGLKMHENLSYPITRDLQGAQEISFALETPDQAREDIIPLLADHCCHLRNSSSYDYEPDFKTYDLLQKAGSLRVFTVRVDGLLAGYRIMILCNNLHHRTILQAAQDSIYLRSDLRGSFVKEFVSWSDHELISEGVKEITQMVKPNSHTTFSIVSLGYKSSEIAYVRRIV